MAEISITERIELLKSWQQSMNVERQNYVDLIEQHQKRQRVLEAAFAANVQKVTKKIANHQRFVDEFDRKIKRIQLDVDELSQQLRTLDYVKK